jgi:DNA-binding transcriptional ArsR family regulator
MTRPLASNEYVDLVFRALSDQTRRELVEILTHHPDGLPAAQLAAHFPNISRPAVAQHLRILADAGFVTAAPRGRERIYSLSRDGFSRAYETWFGKYEAYWRSKLQDLKRHVEDSR